jgi:DNA repair protein RecN (Recombination protein N)
MLTELRVKNYALIKDLVFKPGKSFNVITGETGAGKSILLGALGLILGERTDSVAVKENEEKCVIEGNFNIKNYSLSSWFKQNEFDFSEDVIIRREIAITGKSRAFINDTPAQLTQLKELGKFLIDIHSQHDNLDLFQKSFQFKVLDSFAELQSDQNLFIQKFEKLKELNRKLSELKEAEKQSSDERDYKQFLLEELWAANLVEGELHALEEELSALSNADQNLKILASVHNQLSESETAIIDQLVFLKSQLSIVAKNDKRFEEILNRFGEIQYSLKDLTNELNQLAQHTNNDPERLETVNLRLLLLHNLAKKHRDEDLLLKQKNLEQELSKFANLDNEIKTIEYEKKLIEIDCQATAKSISEQRVLKSILLENQINEMIVQLGMPSAKIKVEVTVRNTEELWLYGLNDSNFLYSPASGKSFSPIQNIASGGEISRVMLVLKAILAKKNTMPTIIFDEIDSGVSGEVALKMGEMLNSMSNDMQLIVITHLPQIAAKGNKHYFVYKNTSGGSVYSDLKELSEQERINEIAEMMGGKDFGKSIQESAKQLLNR